MSDGALERVASQGEILQIFDMRSIEELLPRARGHRGIRRLRRVLELGDIAGENVTASGLEVRYAEICAAAGLPKPDINRWLLLGDQYLKVDFLWRDARVVIETDGDRYHRSGWKRRRDTRRDALLKAHDYLSARISESAIANDPHAATDIARGLLAARSAERRISPNSPQ
ncbi:MAG: endonuclease domain-containing protein [Actinomycetota bacterium]|nr:endonuclease domain-containing protein [Actinomycetota bacterium]